MSNWKCACGHDDLSHSPDLDICGMVGCSCKAFTDQRDAEIAALKLQLEEWRKCGEALKADINESLAQEGMGVGESPASHYSHAFNRLLELLGGTSQKKEGL